MEVLLTRVFDSRIQWCGWNPIIRTKALVVVKSLGNIQLAEGYCFRIHHFYFRSRRVNLPDFVNSAFLCGSA